jgi:hypothetical protein
MIGQNYESIIKSFTKTVNKLKERESSLLILIDARAKRIRQLMDEKEMFTDEAAKCLSTANKISQLLE